MPKATGVSWVCFYYHNDLSQRLDKGKWPRKFPMGAGRQKDRPQHGAQDFSGGLLNEFSSHSFISRADVYNLHTLSSAVGSEVRGWCIDHGGGGPQS